MDTLLTCLYVRARRLCGIYRPELLLKGVYSMKFSKPSKIQSVALPLILAE